MFKYLTLATLALLVGLPQVNAKEIALTFDDAPMGDSQHFLSQKRTEELIRKLKKLKVPPVMIFANPCKREDSARACTTEKISRCRLHHRQNRYTCTHPRLDDIGFDAYSKDAENADRLLAPLFSGQKFFRFPFLNESGDVKLRDQMREWLAKNNYRNGMVSVDNDDYIFSFKINQAKERGQKIDRRNFEELFLKHIMGAVDFYDEFAVKTIGYSPKHVLLLHEMDATVMNLEALVKELRKEGWKIVSVEEAYKDKLYASLPKNTYSGNGIIAQLAFEKTGEKTDSMPGYQKFADLK